MVAPTMPVLYFFNTGAANTDFDDILDSNGDAATNANVIKFDSDLDNKRQPLFQLNHIETFGDENTIDEPEISGGEKTMNKQNIGALPWGIQLTTNITRGAAGDAILKELWRFYHQVQVQYPDREYGIFGLHSNVSEYFDVHPSNIIGYTMKAPIIKVDMPSTIMHVDIMLLIGGKNLVERFA